MQTAAGTVWKGIPTPLDGYSPWPSIGVVAAGISDPHFIVDGSTASNARGIFVVSFANAESVCAYEETPYWTFAEEMTRPGHILNLIVGTELLARIEAMYSGSRYYHFLLCGADMCAEVVAMGYAIRPFPTRDRAEEVLASQVRRSLRDDRLCIDDWQVPPDA